MSARVFYNTEGVIHAIKYTYAHTGYYDISDPRTRWAYVVINETQVKEHLGENNNQDLENQLEIIKGIYLSYLLDGIKQEEEKEYSIYSFSDRHYEVENKLVFCTSALNMYPQEGYYSMLKGSGFNEEAQQLGRPKTKKQENISKLYFNVNIAQDKLSKEYKHYKLTSDKKEYLEHSMVVAIPYVYNFEDNKDIGSKLISKVIEDEATASIISKYDIKGYWCDENKNRLTEHDISNKEQKIYFHIQTKNIDDGTIGKLTVIDKDISLHDEISSLNFTINNNEAFILMELNKIKFHIIDLIKDENDKKIELFTKLNIKKLKLEKELAKDKDENLMTKCGYYKIGTRTLGNSPLYPDSTLGTSPTEIILDYTNKEPIHEHISFKDDQNIGFTTAYTQNNKDSKGEDFGMLKTDPEMSGIPNTQMALAEYDWDEILVDEDTVKEAIYLVINENHYAVSDAIAQMNESDLKRATREGRGAKFFEFTPIIRYTPQNGKRYELLGANCQDFVQKVRDKYKLLKNEAKSKESLS